MACFLEVLALWFGISKEAVAQLIVSFFGSIVAISGAIAAWMAASSAKLSVREMKEARLQSVRPYLDISMSKDTLGICWGRDKNVRIFEDNGSPQHVEGQPLALILTNIGLGPAADICVGFKCSSGGNLTAEKFERAKSTFKLGGIEAKDIGKFFEIGTFGYESYSKEKFPYASFNNRLDLCRSQKKVSANLSEILSHMFFEIALEGLCEPLAKERRRICKTIDMTLDYASPIGETFSRNLVLEISCSKVTAWTNTEWETDVPKNEWNFLKANLLIRISEGQ